MTEEQIKLIAAEVVQGACETDPADADHPDTILITTGDLEAVVRTAVTTLAEIGSL